MATITKAPSVIKYTGYHPITLTIDNIYSGCIAYVTPEYMTNQSYQYYIGIYDDGNKNTTSDYSYYNVLKTSDSNTKTTKSITLKTNHNLYPGTSKTRPAEYTKVPSYNWVQICVDPVFTNNKDKNNNTVNTNGKRITTDIEVRQAQNGFDYTYYKHYVNPTTILAGGSSGFYQCPIFTPKVQPDNAYNQYTSAYLVSRHEKGNYVYRFTETNVASNSQCILEINRLNLNGYVGKNDVGAYIFFRSPENFDLYTYTYVLITTQSDTTVPPTVPSSVTPTPKPTIYSTTPVPGETCRYCGGTIGEDGYCTQCGEHSDSGGSSSGSGATVTPTVSSTPTVTSTVTPTSASTVTVTPTVSSTPTVTPTSTCTVTVTPTVSSTPTVTSTVTASQQPTVYSTTVPPTVTPTSTCTVTVTPTVSSTPTATPTVTPTSTCTVTVTPTVSSTPTATPTVTPTSTCTVTVTPTVSSTPTATSTVTVRPTVSSRPTVSPT